jgi:hypothetical protein
MARLIYSVYNDGNRDYTIIEEKKAFEFLDIGVEVQVSVKMDEKSSVQDIQKQVFKQFPHQKGYSCLFMVTPNQITFSIKKAQTPENIDDSVLIAGM